MGAGSKYVKYGRTGVGAYCERTVWSSETDSAEVGGPDGLAGCWASRRRCREHTPGPVALLEGLNDKENKDLDLGTAQVKRKIM